METGGGMGGNGPGAGSASSGGTGGAAQGSGGMGSTASSSSSSSGAGGMGGAGGGCVSSDEICNGKDDDCNGVIDDNAGCPCTYDTYQGHAYLFCKHMTGSDKWSSDKAMCEGNGYHLATLEDENENDWVYQRGVAAGLGHWFIGLNDQQVEGTWVWDDSSVAKWTNWNVIEPNGGTGANCAAMHFYLDGTWDDDDCNAKFHDWVCEAGP
jgi:hypothetical protein